MPPGHRWTLLAHVLPSATVANARSCRVTAQAPSTTYAFDTVNLSEFPITYLFWVLTLCTEMAAHMCFFKKKKKEEKHNGKRDSIPCTFFVLCCACMCLAEGTKPIGFGDLHPSDLVTLTENLCSESQPAPPCSTSLHLGWSS